MKILFFKQANLKHNFTPPQSSNSRATPGYKNNRNEEILASLALLIRAVILEIVPSVYKLKVEERVKQNTLTHFLLEQKKLIQHQVNRKKKKVIFCKRQYFY